MGSSNSSLNKIKLVHQRFVSYVKANSRRLLQLISRHVRLAHTSVQLELVALATNIVLPCVE